MQQKTRALGAHGVWVVINMYIVRYLCVRIDIHLSEYTFFCFLHILCFIRKTGRRGAATPTLA